MSEAAGTSFQGQLAAAATIVLANGWSSPERLTQVQAAAANAADPLPTAGRSRAAQFLVEQRIVTREQAQDLDAILKVQGNLPGFRLQRKIGSGGMGIVFLATHLATNRQVALKTLNKRLAEEQDFISRFHREAESLVGIKHPNIAEIIESGECDGNCYLAMEYIDGPSVMTLLRDYKALPETYALRIARQIADGLAYVYQRAKLVHRDIKPENILMVRAPLEPGELFSAIDVAKLIDFGLVKSMSDDDQRLTQTGMTIGTPLYMSPEQVRGETLDCRSDIYGIGATLYHLVTGVTPFTGSSPGAIMSAHLTEEVPDPSLRVPSLSAETRQIIATAMAKDPDQRFLTHEALVRACDKALEQLGSRGEGAPRLLRKPLVLKQGRKPETSRFSGGSVGTSTKSARDISSRIITKHRDAKAPSDPSPPGTHAAVNLQDDETVTTVPRTPPGASPALSPRASPTPVTGAAHASASASAPPAAMTGADAQLLAEARHAHQTGRIGLLPILALGGALAALAGFLIYHFVT